MFPLKNTEAYIHANGFRSTLGKELADRDAEISELGSEIQALTNQLTSDTPTTVDYASVINLTDALGVNAKDVKLKVEPVQDRHGYTKPWVGGAGKNKLKTTGTSTTNVGVSYTVNSDGTILVNGTADISGSGQDTSLFVVGSIELEGGVTYVLSSSAPNDNDFFLQLVGSGISDINTKSGAKTFTPSASLTATARIIVNNGKTVSNITIKPMMCLSTASNPTTYEPYTNICPITGWTGANVTVADAETDPTTTETYVISFGGTYYLAELDVTSGVLTVLGVFTEPTEFTAKSGTTSNNLYQTDAYANIGTTVALMSQAICNRFEYVDYGTLYANNVKAFGITSDGKIGIGLGLDGPATLEDANTWLSNNPLQIVYMLATSQTIQLTPTQIQLLQGNNAISADCGDVSIQYFKELNIGGAVAELQTAVNAILAQLS